MKKVFNVLAAALLAEAAFGVVLSGRSNIPMNGSLSKCATINGVAFEMVFVQGGKDKYGVGVSDFWIGRFEVTQQQWLVVMGFFPAAQNSGSGDNCPVYHVSWNDAQKFIDSLNVRYGGGKFRLPTEREWEYAARGGSAQQSYMYAGSDTAGNVMWYGSNSGNAAHVVGGKAPNGIGAYDMSGNVREWCQDYYGGFGGESAIPVPTPTLGANRVLRGGFYDLDETGCTVSYRYSDAPDNRVYSRGLRLACSSNP
jgi:formylglycine-generating enzyme required for sulfatase activity